MMFMMNKTCDSETVLPRKRASGKKITRLLSSLLVAVVVVTVVHREQRKKLCNVVTEQQTLKREEVSVDGWLNKTSAFNKEDCCLLPV